MARPLSLRRRVKVGKRSVPEDLRAVEAALVELGHLEPPKAGFAGAATRKLDDAIRTLQSRHNLKPDGIVKPLGPTAERMNALLVARRGAPPAAEARRPPGAPSFLNPNARSLLGERLGGVPARGAEAPEPASRRGPPPGRETRHPPRGAPSRLNPDGPTLVGNAMRGLVGEPAGLGDTPPPERPRSGLEGMAPPTFRDQNRDPTQSALEEIDSGKGVDREPAVPINLGPPTDAPVDVAKMYRELQFDLRGPGEMRAALVNPAQGVAAAFMSEAARAATEDGIKNNNLPDRGMANNAADAFRHALWSYKMAKRMGYATAKRIGDGHEITVPSPQGVRLMDLYNNEVGRQLAAVTSNHDLSDEDVIFKALRDGKLRIKPFNVAVPSEHPGMGGRP